MNNVRPPLHVAVFAKAPVAGQAKTRLIPLLGAEGAARLHQVLVEATLATACVVKEAQVTLWYAGDANHSLWQRLARDYPITLQPQQGTDLGARMQAAFKHTLRSDARCLLIGTDCPALTTAHLEQSAQLLLAHPAVFTPALDGGYVLVGLARHHQLTDPLPTAWPKLFDNIAWGSAQVMQSTRLRAAELALALQEQNALSDLDTPQDYAAAQAWLPPH